MSVMASQITGVSIVNSTVCSGADQRKHQISSSLAIVREIHRWPVNSPHKGLATRKMFPFDDVIMFVSFIQLVNGIYLLNNFPELITKLSQSGGHLTPYPGQVGHFDINWLIGQPLFDINLLNHLKFDAEVRQKLSCGYLFFGYDTNQRNYGPFRKSVSNLPRSPQCVRMPALEFVCVKWFGNKKHSFITPPPW